MRVRAPSKRWWHHPRPNKRFKRLHTALTGADQNRYGGTQSPACKTKKPQNGRIRANMAAKALEIYPSWYNVRFIGKSDSSTSEPGPLTRAHLSADRPTYRKDCTPNDRPDILPLRVSPQNAKPYCFGVATRAGICGVR